MVSKKIIKNGHEVLRKIFILLRKCLYLFYFVSLGLGLCLDENKSKLFIVITKFNFIVSICLACI